MNTNFPNCSLAWHSFAAVRRALLFLTLCTALTTATVRAQESQTAQPPPPSAPGEAIQPPQEPPAKSLDPHSVLRQGNPVVYQSFQPCRMVDTRNSPGDFGGPKLVAGATRNFNLVPGGGGCGDTLPAGATALAINVTITETENSGHLTAWPGAQPQPNASVINWTSPNTTVANAIIVPVGTDGSINIFSSQGTHLILDISGYLLSTLEAGDQFAIVGNNSSAAILGQNNGSGAGVRGESASGVAGYFAGNAVVTGNLGVGTETPGSKLTVAGVIESSMGGIKFPDGTVQTSASAGVAGNFIQNTTAQQAASNFHISGNGTAGGTLSAATVNAATAYNIGGQRVLSAAGSTNLFAGVGAGAALTTGNGNAFFGRDAGRANTTGNGNAFFGALAGFSNTTGGDNAFFGRSAGESNTTGNSNIFFGFSAGARNTTGSANAFFGNSAGVGNTTGGDNAFFGRNVGQSNTEGNNNAFFGAQTGAFNTTGGNNAFFGALAGRSNTTGNNNTMVGSSADVSSANLQFATAIGAGAIVSTSNTVVLGRGSDTVRVPGRFAPAQGFRLRSPGGNCFLLAVTDAGAVTAVSVPVSTCP